MLRGKTAVITGSAQGIGKEIALLFAANGANVVVSDVAAEAVAMVAEEIERGGGQCLAVPCDVRKLADCEALMAKSLERFGAIDILVNNAGVTRDNLLLRMKEEDWDLVLDVNLKGAFNCCKSVSRTMMKRHSGRIINISSVVGLIGNAGQVNYSASKAGLIGLTKSLAKEFGSRGVNVNAIAPGFIQTAMTDKLTEEARRGLLEYIPFQKLGAPRDVANAALFLASPLAEYITGEVIRVDGGMAM